jgi:signal peptidase I
MSSAAKGLSHFWRQYARPFLVVVVIMVAFRSSIADWNDVPTGSMRPTILEGDRIFVNKLAYDLKVPYFTTIHLAHWADPKRGDVVVFFSPENGIRLVKRVIAVPGDTVEIRDARVFINGKPAEYSKLDASVAQQVEESRHNEYVLDWELRDGKKHPVIFNRSIPSDAENYRRYGPLKVPEGKYLAMGDNRDNSRDSRWIGLIPRENIVGRASRVVTSLDEHYSPRWKRFFSPLP